VKQKLKQERVHRAWAIECHSTGGMDKGARFLLGKYWVFAEPIPEHVEGYRIAVWETRQLARDFAKMRTEVEVIYPWQPQYIVRKVEITVRIVR